MSYDTCAYCGAVIEGRSYRCGRGVVHESCLDEMKEPKSILDFIKDNTKDIVEFLSTHMSDDFLDELWNTFREEYETDIERWATT